MAPEIMPYSSESSYALVIGVGQRPEDDVLMRISATDAQRFSDELINRCPFVSANIKSLINQSATRNGINQTLDEYIEKTKEHPADMFMLYFSGHGYVHHGKYYLVCRDTKNNNVENTALESSRFIEKLQAIRTNKMVVFLDCCHAAGITENAGNALDDDSFHLKQPNRIVLTASHAQQVSFLSQPVSVFTYALIKGLAGSYFQSSDKNVTIFDLAMYVRELVWPLSKNKQQPQLNVLEDANTSNFILAHYPEGRPTDLVFSERFKLLDASGKEISSGIQPETDTAYRNRFEWLKKNVVDITGNQNIAMQDIADSHVNIQTGNNTNPTTKKKPANTMDLTTIARHATKFLFPYISKNKAVAQISNEITEAANTSLLELWNWVKPVFIEEFTDDEALDADVENEQIVEREIKRSLKKSSSSDLDKFNKLIELLVKDESEGRLPRVNTSNITGDRNTVIQDVENSNINIHHGDVTNQHADEITNIKNIDKADFS